MSFADLPPVLLPAVLLALQGFQVAILWLHDWLPLGPLNDTRAVRRQYAWPALVRTTLIQSLPFTVGLVFSALAWGRPYPTWLWIWLWVSYVVLFLGELRAWWVPYLLAREPERAARYQRMFGSTHAFLPKRNGIVPNTLHCLLHLATAATLGVLWLMSRG